MSILDGKRALFRWVGVDAGRFAPQVSMQYGFFRFSEKNRKVESFRFGGDASHLTIGSGSGNVGRVRFERTKSGNLRTVVSISKNSGFNSLRLRFSCRASDRFWGFGEQYNAIDFRGKVLPIWVSEQGVGRSENPNMPFIGRLTDTYFPIPYFMDPADGKGFLIENSEYSRFDLCASNAGEWSAEVWNGDEISFLIFPGPNPSDVVSQLTSEVGRPKLPPPDWAFSGVWLAAQGGRDAVEKRLATALDAGVPVSALWAQDWVGRRHFGGGNYGVKYRWILDEEYYPEFEEMIRSMRAKNVRFLGYFNPFIIPDYEHYKVAVENNYLIRTPDGKPYVFPIVMFKGGLLDVTNPDAAEWFRGYAHKAAQMGISGWMADFGEWLPFDARIANGDARSLHNLYPTEWHRLNRQELDAAHPDGDYVLLTRSGYTGEQRVAQIVWAGDQEADWTDTDGLPTVVTAGLTLGLSGVPFFTHDIAGFSGGPSSKELFLRWTELGAFTPVMRTHDGLKKLQNHRFDSDPETLAFFRRMAKIHSALLPYFRQLAADAVQKGLPVIRHTAMVDPEWSRSLEANRQWMIGNDLLFVPVVAQGKTSVEVNFPKGEWENLFSGKKYKGWNMQTVDAPLGAPRRFLPSRLNEQSFR